MAKMYANENFPLGAVMALRDLGHDVLTSTESGMANRAIPDDEVLAFAVEQSRILLTFNRLHFKRLHGANPHHAGIVLCTIDPDVKALAQRIDAAVSAQPDMAGHLLRVNRPG